MYKSIEIKMDKILNGKRFDLFAKYIYLKYYLMGVETDWYVRLYNNHILVFNGAWEYPGDKTKESEFTDSFNTLIKSISENGYKMNGNEIEVTGEYILANNAHRFIIAYHLNLTPPIMVNSNLNFIKGYDYKFFSNRYSYGLDGLPEYAANRVLNSMNEVWMKEMVLEACKLKNDTKVITIFPIASPNFDSC